LKNNDPGINPLDASCKQHDIEYAKTKDLKARHTADKILQERAWERVRAKDASLGEKAVAWAVTNAMKVKRKLGMGIKRSGGGRKKRVGGKRRKCGANKRVGRGIRKTKIKKTKKVKKTVLRKIVDAAKRSMKPNTELRQVVQSALKGARAAIRSAGGRRLIQKPRVLPVPSKIGGFLPAFLVPLFAALSAAGSIAGGASAIVKAVNDVRASQRSLDEMQRHNKAMESPKGIVVGQGIRFAPYRKGYGLYLWPYSKNELDYQTEP